jgi:uncharacterized protein YbjT (DUF2867 family)
MDHQPGEKQMRTAVIAGASGLVGGHLLLQLLVEHRYQHVYSFGRRNLPVEHSKLRQLIVDFDALDLKGLPAGQVDYFCCLGTTLKKAGSKEAFRKVDYDYPLGIAKAASLNQKASFSIVTALGANPDSVFFYNRVKGDLEMALRQLPLNSLHIFQPSLLLGNRAESRVGEKIAQQISSMLTNLWLGPIKKYRPIEAAVVAKAMLLVALSDVKGVHVYPSNHIERIAYIGAK